MAGDAKKLQPIIIKKVKKGGHAAHGGAWKIAYADFVTAMMAFFLLMWLLGSTTEGDKKGIADYFQSPLKVALLAGGSGSGDSSHVLKGGGEDLTRSTGQVKRGDIEAKRKTVNLQALKAEQVRAEISRLEQLKGKIEQKIEQNPKLAAMKSQIRLDMTADGLRIQIVDENQRPMFSSGSAVVQPYMRELLREIGTVIENASLDAVSRAGLASAWSALYRASATPPSDLSAAGATTPGTGTAGATSPGAAVPTSGGAADPAAPPPAEAYGAGDPADPYLDPYRDSPATTAPASAAPAQSAPAAGTPVGTTPVGQSGGTPVTLPSLPTLSMPAVGSAESGLGTSPTADRYPPASSERLRDLVADPNDPRTADPDTDPDPGGAEDANPETGPSAGDGAQAEPAEVTLPDGVDLTADAAVEVRHVAKVYDGGTEALRDINSATAPATSVPSSPTGPPASSRNATVRVAPAPTERARSPTAPGRSRAARVARRRRRRRPDPARATPPAVIPTTARTSSVMSPAPVDRRSRGRAARRPPDGRRGAVRLPPACAEPRAPAGGRRRRGRRRHRRPRTR